jgi:hypothetical protein
MKDLGGFGGTCTVASDLNNRGEVVGQSNHPDDLAQHPFVWDRVTGITELPTGAGIYGDSAAINDDGEIVGEGDAPDGQASATLWRKTGGKWRTTYLGRLHSGDCARAVSINASSQVVGVSGPYGCSVTLAFLREDGGPVVDLNTLVPPTSGLQLIEAHQINDRGEIAVEGREANGANHSVLLIPCDEGRPGVEGCDYDLVDAATAARPSLAPATQPPAALTPSSHMPGMLNRFRFPRGQRATGFGTLPTPEAKQALPANTDSNYLEADHRLGQQPAPRQFGYCMVSNGLINGTCSKYNYYSCLAKPSTYCPRGQKAKKPGYFRCSSTRQTFVDLGRGCFF